MLLHEGRKAVAELSYQIVGLRKPTNDFNCPICQARELRTLIIPPLLEKEMYDEESRYPWYLAERSTGRNDGLVAIGMVYLLQISTQNFYLGKLSAGDSDLNWNFM